MGKKNKKKQLTPEEAKALEEKLKQEQDEKESLEKERPFKCPVCDYRAKLQCHLARHINHYHKELTDRTPKHLLAAISTKNNVSDMLASVAEWMDGATSFDERLPEDVISYLQKEDAKTQLILRVIAIDKIQRALELGDRIKKVEKEFDLKLEDQEFKDNATVHTYLGLVERMQELQEKELHFLKEISQLGEVNLNDVVDKLVTAFGTARLGTKPAGGFRAFQLTGVDMPEEPGEREKMRRILHKMGVGDLAEEENGSSGRDQPIEAEYEEGSGASAPDDSKE